MVFKPARRFPLAVEPGSRILKKPNEMDLTRTITASMDEDARPASSGYDIEHLGVLIRLTVEFHYFLQSAPPWPRFPGDPLNDRAYAIESIFAGIDSFKVVMQAYGILVGSTPTTIDWSAVTVQSLKVQFCSMFEQFVAEKEFEKKCRLLLDMFKLQIVFSGAYY